MQEKRTMLIVKLVTALATLVVVVLVGVVSFQTIKMKSLQRKQETLDEQIIREVKEEVSLDIIPENIFDMC